MNQESPAFRHGECQKTKQEQTFECWNKIEAGVKDIFVDNQYKDYLVTGMAKMPNHNYVNSLLAYLTKPDFTELKTFDHWSDLGHQIKKGSKAIYQLKPEKTKIKVSSVKRDDQGNIIPGVFEEKVEECTRMVAQPYFDASQTYSYQPAAAPTLQSDKVVAALSELYPNIDKGFETAPEKLQVQILEVSYHELNRCYEGHLKTFAEEKDLTSWEVEATGIACVVCQKFGIGTNALQFNDLSEWGANRSLDQLKRSLVTVQRESSHIIKTLEKVYEQTLTKENTDKQPHLPPPAPAAEKSDRSEAAPKIGPDKPTEKSQDPEPKKRAVKQPKKPAPKKPKVKKELLMER